MENRPQDQGGHEALEQKLVAALRDLVREVELADYRDAGGRALRDSRAFQKAKALADGREGARQLSEEEPTAEPDWTPPEYSTWHTGP